MIFADKYSGVTGTLKAEISHFLFTNKKKKKTTNVEAWMPFLQILINTCHETFLLFLSKFYEVKIIHRAKPFARVSKKQRSIGLVDFFTSGISKAGCFTAISYIARALSKSPNKVSISANLIHVLLFPGVYSRYFSYNFLHRSNSRNCSSRLI